MATTWITIFRGLNSTLKNRTDNTRETTKNPITNGISSNVFISPFFIVYKIGFNS